MEDNLELHLNSSHQQVSDRACSTILGGSMEFEKKAAQEIFKSTRVTKLKTSRDI